MGRVGPPCLLPLSAAAVLTAIVSAVLTAIVTPVVITLPLLSATTLFAPLALALVLSSIVLAPALTITTRHRPHASTSFWQVNSTHSVRSVYT